MRHQDQCIPSGSTPARPSPAVHPSRTRSPAEYLADVRDRDESLTAAEAEFAGPWKLEPLPGHPGAVAVLRECESLAEGDEPEAVFLEEETAADLHRRPAGGRARAALPPGGGRRRGRPDAGRLPDGRRSIGEQGPRVRGWLRRYHPEARAGTSTPSSRSTARPRPTPRCSKRAAAGRSNGSGASWRPGGGRGPRPLSGRRVGARLSPASRPRSDGDAGLSGSILCL